MGPEQRSPNTEQAFTEQPNHELNTNTNTNTSSEHEHEHKPKFQENPVSFYKIIPV